MTKTYKIDQSPLFKLYQKKRLSKLLGLTDQQLERLSSSSDNYRVFSKVIRGKERTIETPKPHLASVHKRIHQLLTKIRPPDYLHSGVRGRSYITNAKQHDGQKAGFKLDIKSFYPSTTTSHVYRALKQLFLCSHGVAETLAKLLTIDGHLPTGSSASQCVAFFSHRQMFDEIHTVMNEAGGYSGVYVDDIYVSIECVKHWHVRRVERIIKAQGLESHKKRVYGAATPKLITGLVLGSDGSTLLPNAKHLGIREKSIEFRKTEDSSEKLAVIRSLTGQLTTASLIDPKLKSRAQSAQRYKKHLESLNAVSQY